MILQYPHRILTTKSIRATLKEFSELSDKLLETYKSTPCAGVAAPQIGINKRVFIAKGELYFNPTIIDYLGGIVQYSEGCLSIPKKSLEVPRHTSIRMSWTSLGGKKFCDTFTGYIAEILQHEYDHLNGKLLIHCMQTEMPLYIAGEYHFVHQ